MPAESADRRALQVTAPAENAPAGHDEHEPRARRTARWLALVLVVALAAGAGWWAARVTTAHDIPEVDAGSQQVQVEVVDGTVGRALAVNVTVARPFRLLASNSLEGVVTSVGGGDAQLGEPVFVVAGVPARAVVGVMPFYRDLAGGTSGADVTQLQDALRDLGYFQGSSDGRFGASTTRAVTAWQKAVGEPATGTVTLGSLIAFPQLPATYRLDEDFVVGAVVGGGEPAVFAPAGDAEFRLVLGADQARLVPAEADVMVTFEDLQWAAVVTSSTVGEDGSTTFALVGPDGGAVCGEQCASLPGQEQITLLAQVQVVPQTTGPAVPVAAVRTAADGGTYVVLPGGDEEAVTVLAAGDGLAIVDGLTAGDQVVVLDAASSTHGGAGEPDQG